MQPEVAHHYAKLGGKMSEPDFLARIAKARDDLKGLLGGEAPARPGQAGTGGQEGPRLRRAERTRGAGGWGRPVCAPGGRGARF